MKLKLVLALMMSLGCMALSSCDKSKYTIGICQLVTHQALDAATEGFIDAVKDGLGEENVEFLLHNASNNPDICLTIANNFVAKNVDLIMANATSSLQAAANSTMTIPILGTSITDYASALSLENYQGVVGGNISGTSDLAPLNEQAQMLIDLFPDAKEVGLLYCSSEANSIYQIDIVERYLNEHDVSTRRLAFSDSNEISIVLNGAINNVDAIYIPTDNTAAECTSIIDSICRPASIPIVCGEENTCRGCGVVSLSIDYYKIGHITGEMAVEILKDGKDISQMPIQFDPEPSKKFNKEICDELEIQVPSDYIEIE